MNKEYEQIDLAIGRYANTTPLVGYIEKEPIYRTSTPYHPYMSSHDQILEENLKASIKGVKVAQNWVKMPYDRQGALTTDSYQIVPKPKSLETTLVSTWLIPKENIQQAKSEFVIRGQRLLPLQRYSEDNQSFQVFSNGGYFVTPNLIYQGEKSKIWAHNRRYPDHQIPEGYAPFYGWYYRNTPDGIKTTYPSTLHTGKVYIDSAGKPSLLPSIDVSVNSVTINGFEFQGREIITPTHKSEKVESIEKDIVESGWDNPSWQTYHEIIKNNRINIFVTNKGKGTFPQDYVTAIWEGSYPAINFGYIISISQSEFQKQQIKMGDKVNVSLTLPEEYRGVEAIYDLSATLIKDQKVTLETSSADGIMQSFNSQGFTHPSFQLSQESIPLSPFKRVPSHVYIETENYFGGMIFNGRYELSIGACMLDEVHILGLFQKHNLLPESIQTAIKADGGSGAKVALSLGKGLRYANLPAPGTRNAFGDGNSNFYHGLAFKIK